MLKSVLLCGVLMAPVAGTYPCNAAAPAKAEASMSHEGKVVSASDNKLVMTDNDGKNEHSHMVTPTAKVMLNGKSAKMSDLQKGDAIKVTMSPESVITMVEATRGN